MSRAKFLFLRIFHDQYSTRQVVDQCTVYGKNGLRSSVGEMLRVDDVLLPLKKSAFSTAQAEM